VADGPPQSYRYFRHEPARGRRVPRLDAAHPCDHSIDEWKYPTIARLVLQNSPLSAVDLETLGFKMAADILHVRERDIFDPDHVHGGKTRVDTTSDTDREIYKLFGCKAPWLAENPEFELDAYTHAEHA
jgi:hypothetical protein